jgi:hypothetical protein
MHAPHAPDPVASALSLPEAAALAGCCVKTLRRAIAAGALPRRYRDHPRGPQLILDPAVLAAWLRACGRPVPATLRAAPALTTAVPAAPAPTGPELGAALAQARAGTRELAERVAALRATVEAAYARAEAACVRAEVRDTGTSGASSRATRDDGD